MVGLPPPAGLTGPEPGRPAAVLPTTVDTWLAEFADCVRARDHDRARPLFAADAAGFGTVSDRWAGLDDLRRSQWAPVWERTEGFAFDDVVARWSAPGLAVVAAAWSSRRVGGGRRTGRVTLVLRTEPDGALRAVHSHFSMTPGTPP